MFVEHGLEYLEDSTKVITKNIREILERISSYRMLNKNPKMPQEFGQKGGLRIRGNTKSKRAWEF